MLHKLDHLEALTIYIILECTKFRLLFKYGKVAHLFTLIAIPQNLTEITVKNFFKEKPQKITSMERMGEEIIAAKRCQQNRLTITN